MEQITHASLALEDSNRHQPEFKPTTARVDWLLQILASAREARALGMTTASMSLRSTGPEPRAALFSLDEDLASLGYLVSWAGSWTGAGAAWLTVAWSEEALLEAEKARLGV